jgi:thiol:disulfide interchange protein DsbC
VPNVPALIVIALTVMLFGPVVSAQSGEPIGARLRQLYPGTPFDAVAATPVPGLSEAVMGTNIAYVDASGRYFLFGRLFDMQTQTDLTAVRLERVSAIDFGVLPAELAIRTVRGSGRRTLAVFSDPDCPHCRALEETLAALEDVTILTFLHPVEALHPGARDRAIAVWCAADRAQAWSALMRQGIAPPASTCDHPIDSITALGAHLRLQGTPTLFAGDGRRLVGARTAAELDAWLQGRPLERPGAGQ